MTINCQGHIFKELYTLAEKHEAGVPAREAAEQYRQIMVDLNTIKYTPPRQHMKKGQMKDYSPEDVFMMSSAQPASHGKIVKNEYFIAIRTAFDGCTCCADTPIARTPLTIMPVHYPAIGTYVAPPDFQPVVQPVCQVSFAVSVHI